MEWIWPNMRASSSPMAWATPATPATLEPAVRWEGFDDSSAADADFPATLRATTDIPGPQCARHFGQRRTAGGRYIDAVGPFAGPALRAVANRADGWLSPGQCRIGPSGACRAQGRASYFLWPSFLLPPRDPSPPKG